MSTQTKPEQDKATARPPTIRYSDGGFEIQFKPGEWGQFACMAHSRWMAPGQANNILLRKASECLPALIVKAVNEYDALNAIAKSASALANRVKSWRAGVAEGIELDGLQKQVQADLATFAALRKEKV